MMRIGIVSDRDVERCEVRVTFEQDDVVSPWAPVVQPLSVGAAYYRLPEINEQVLCLLDNNGDDVFVLGAIYGGDVQPTETGEKITAVKFDDGTVVKYNRQNSKMDIQVSGNLAIKASKIEVDGDVKIQGALEASGSIRAIGNITSGPVGATVSLLTHIHAGSGVPPTPNT